MPVNINLIPKASQNLLSGAIQSPLSDSASFFVGNVIPSSSRLPTYLWIDYGTSKAELVKVYDVSGSNVYIKRGLNNGGVGFSHDTNAPYYEAITVEHWNSMVDALQTGWFLDHSDIYTFSKVNDTTFRIASIDRTNFYTAKRKIRFNGSIETIISSSTYTSGNTDVVVTDSVVPSTISSVELETKFPIHQTFLGEHTSDGKHGNVTASGLSLVLGSDADGDMYYRASGKLARLPKGTTSQFLRGGDAPSWQPAVMITTAKARAFRSGSNQSIPNATSTKVQLNAETYDPGNNFDSTTNYRFVAPISGYYIVNGGVRFLSATDQCELGIMFFKNGGSITEMISRASGISYHCASGSDIIYLAANDFLELYVWQGSGGAVNILADSRLTFMAVHLLSVA